MIRSQVVATAGWLAREDIVRLDILSVACSGDVFAQAQSQLNVIRERVRVDDPESQVTLLRGVRSAMPGGTMWNRRLLTQYLARHRGRYRVIHARTDYAAFVLGPLAHHNGIRLVWDCRGDAVAEFLGRSTLAGWPHTALRRYRAASLATQASEAAAGCQAAIFVTTNLRDRFARLVRGPKHVIPTVADQSRFYFSPELRVRTRAALGYDDEQPVFVFSGTFAPYQGFPEAVRYFIAVAEREPRARLLVLTPALDYATRQLNHVNPALWSACSVDFDDMNGMLNAADFALLTRPPSAINISAFPTKFAEYGLAGLQVIMSNTLPDCFAHATRAGNLVAVDNPAPRQPNLIRRREVSRYYRDELTQSCYAVQYREIYWE